MYILIEFGETVRLVIRWCCYDHLMEMCESQWFKCSKNGIVMGWCEP